MKHSKRNQYVPLGQVVATRGAVNEIPEEEMLYAICRHHCCDWGDVCTEDWLSNEHALRNDLRLLSVYRTKAGQKYYIITEADRTATTVLLPEEY